jgi:membrane protein YdbS with pleckstrin-like domain
VIQTRLLDDERLLLGPIHRHWALLARWAWGPAALLLLAIGVNVTLNWWLDLYYQYVGARSGLADPRLSPVLPDLRLAFTLLLLAVAGFWFISLWIRWWSLTVTITEYRVIIDTGTVPHNSHVIGVDRILDVSTYQTAMGKTLNYGTVKINGADQHLDFIPDPQGLAEDIFIHITNLRKGGAKGPEPGKEELLEMEADAEAGIKTDNI